MDTKEAMKIVAEQVIVKGDERIEEALQTVENALGLEPVISHGGGQPFHYIQLRFNEKQIDYNKLYDLAREKFYDRLQTKDSFARWAQKHTAIDHVNGALIIRTPINETHDGGIEFHDEYSFLATDGDNEGTDSVYFESLLFIALDAREGRAESA